MSSSNTLFEDDHEKSSESQLTSDNEIILKDSNSFHNGGGIATKESKAVNQLRLLVLFVLTTAGITVCLLVYYLSLNDMYDQFDSQYDGQADQINLAFQRIPYEKFGSLGALRVSIMSEALDKNTTWPLYCVSSFEKRAAVAMRLSETLSISINPYIHETNRSIWEEYTAKVGPAWINNSLLYQSHVGMKIFGETEELLMNNSQQNQTNWPIMTYGKDSNNLPDHGPGPYLPFWQISPLITSLVNFNYLRMNVGGYRMEATEPLLSYASSKAVTSAFKKLKPGGIHSFPPTATNYYSGFLSTKAGMEVDYVGDPISDLYIPVAKSFDDNTTVAIIIALLHWASDFDDLLPVNEKDITVVIDDSCTGPSTFIIQGTKAVFIGNGDQHETRFDEYVRASSWNTLDAIQDGTETGLSYLSSHCPPSIQIYPTTDYYNQFDDKQAIYMTLTVALVFAFTIVVFISYDRLVEKRQNLVLRKAMQSSAIVASLFPENIANRLMQQQDTTKSKYNNKNNKKLLHSFVVNGENDAGSFEMKMNEAPIADLFLNSTVFFADIAGFTAWSSSREPAQVFVLLQNVYQAFDKIAKRRKVFKVETIGDSYVAVTGCPEIQEQHALIMARFATDCQQKMREVTSSLCVTLGPDTNELSMRIGMHSGPVTAGVLQGDRARFQLFGDTVNTASRMESTGIKNKIQVSQSTAECLIDAEKGHWLSPREDKVTAKGKGLLVTYWLDIYSNSRSSIRSTSQTNSSNDPDAKTLEVNERLATHVLKTNDNHELLIDWVCELLQTHIKKLLATRKRDGKMNSPTNKPVFETDYLKNPLDEVVEAIAIPEYVKSWKFVKYVDHMEDLDPFVSAQLRHYISLIASTYRNNHFHNFQHACHVAMSSNKLLMRVVNPIFDDTETNNNTRGDLDHRIYDYTYGINSDPITILAVILSAIIHDVDHRGVSNTQLMKEEKYLSKQYRNKSVAEQNSLDIAWSIFISDEFSALRDCIFITQKEVDRFRQVLINCVLATDIFDKELNDLRKQRWKKAFFSMPSNSNVMNQSEHSNSNLHATIVMEHVIQASDVAHTMQHWHVYQKWNKLLFLEMYEAYQCGRMSTNPCNFWYEGELSFFDNYIIPLARKLKECNVFGVSSDEYLNYAEKNRVEWEMRGQEIVTEMIGEMHSIDRDISMEIIFEDREISQRSFYSM